MHMKVEQILRIKVDQGDVRVIKLFPWEINKQIPLNRYFENYPLINNCLQISRSGMNGRMTYPHAFILPLYIMSYLRHFLLKYQARPLSITVR